MGASKNNTLDWLRLIRSEKVGPITFYRLVERYGSVDRALEALPETTTGRLSTGTTRIST